MNATSPTIVMPALGAQATEFYQALFEQHREAADDRRKPAPLQVVPMNFEAINAHLPDGFGALMPLLQDMFLVLEQEAPDRILVPNITLHAAIDRLEIPAETGEKIIHPLFAGINRIKLLGLDAVTLTGTRHTMQTDLITDYFEQRNIGVLTPEPEDIQKLDLVRIAVSESGYSDALRAEMSDVLGRYSNIVIACTELSILNAGNAHIDLARLQIEQAVLGN